MLLFWRGKYDIRLLRATEKGRQGTECSARSEIRAVLQKTEGRSTGFGPRGIRPYGAERRQRVLTRDKQFQFKKWGREITSLGGHLKGGSSTTDPPSGNRNEAQTTARPQRGDLEDVFLQMRGKEKGECGPGQAGGHQEAHITGLNYSARKGSGHLNAAERSSKRQA